MVGEDCLMFGSGSVDSVLAHMPKTTMFASVQLDLISSPPSQIAKVFSGLETTLFAPDLLGLASSPPRPTADASSDGGFIASPSLDDIPILAPVLATLSTSPVGTAWSWLCS